MGGGTLIMVVLGALVVVLLVVVVSKLFQPLVGAPGGAIPLEVPLIL